MLKKHIEVIQKGDASGNGMVVRFKLESGIEIIGLPAENDYGGEWNLGPTWNYLVLADEKFLFDTGKPGSGKKILAAMEMVGVSGKDLDFIMVSHGHEDHDGSLTEIVKATGAPVRGHRIYDRLIRTYPPGKAPNKVRDNLPAGCWHCFIPGSFPLDDCSEYRKERKELVIEKIEDEKGRLTKTSIVHHIPGHTPDSLAVLLENEAILVGDTILPDITPWPSQEAFFHQVKEVIGRDCLYPVYGLKTYLNSLLKLKEIAKDNECLLVLPGHRLFFNNEWKDIDLSSKIHELTEHHIERCGAILKIITKKQLNSKEIAIEYFDEKLLNGFGMFFAENEILSHCELLINSNDLTLDENGLFKATGNSNFESMIRSL